MQKLWAQSIYWVKEVINYLTRDFKLAYIYKRVSTKTHFMRLKRYVLDNGIFL